LPGGVADAGAVHGLAAADEEFEAHEVLPQLHRKAEGPALSVLELLRTQQILRQVHPPDAFQARGDRVLRQIFPHPGKVGPGDFIQQVLFHSSNSGACGSPVNYEKPGEAGVLPATQSAPARRLCHQFFKTFQGSRSLACGSFQKPEKAIPALTLDFDL